VKSAIIAFIVAFLVFEFIEHVVLPLIWWIKDRNKKSKTGVTGMIGKVVEIKKWDKNQGRVLFHGELWRAVCDVPLPVGGKGVIVDVAGLTLTVKPLETVNSA
jgi:membrane protein implicated in regulation of membrane protease activity